MRPLQTAVRALYFQRYASPRHIEGLCVSMAVNCGEIRLQLEAGSCGPSTLSMRQCSRPQNSACVNIPGKHLRRCDTTTGSPVYIYSRNLPNRAPQIMRHAITAVMHQPWQTQAEGRSDGQGGKAYIFSADTILVSTFFQCQTNIDHWVFAVSSDRMS